MSQLLTDPGDEEPPASDAQDFFAFDQSMPEIEDGEEVKDKVEPVGDSVRYHT